MERIIKIRTIPRGYTPLDDDLLIKAVKNATKEKSVADFFMALNMKFGNPQEDGMFSYMLRHGSVVLKITAIDKEHMDFKVWVSPQSNLDAKRRKTKIMNIIARRLNENDVAFMLDGVVPNGRLYFAVRQKNDRLLKARKWSDEEIRSAMTDGERMALYGGMAQHMPSVLTDVTELIKEIFV